MKASTINSLSIIILAAGLIISSNRVRDMKSDIVYSVCNQSRVSIEITEHECAALQDKWQREFLCAHADRDARTVCWVEVK